MKKNILITAGGTIVKIDDVRHIANMSSGKFGVSLALELAKRPDTHITLLLSKSGALRFKDTLNNSQNITVAEYETYYEYSSHLQYLLVHNVYHSVISSAAVSDYVVDGETNGKISGDSLVTITLKPVPKLLPMIKFLQPNTFLVGFKLLVGADESEKNKAITKQFDSAHSDIVAFNDLKSSVKKYELYTSPQEFTTIQGDTLVEDFADIIMNEASK